MTVPTTRHITPGSGHRDLALSCDQPGRHLNLHVGERFGLGFGETPDVVMRQVDVTFECVGHRMLGAFGSFVTDDDVTGPAIELDRALACYVLATGFDSPQQLLGALTHICFAGRCGFGCLLEVLDGHGCSSEG